MKQRLLRQTQKLVTLAGKSKNEPLEMISRGSFY